ncbi:hypothetical protein FA95DRAFT_1487053, partial [Auriscalpium vulgare]
WPPQDPTAVSHDPDHKFELPDSPWTYENGSVNPDLKPSSARARRRHPVAAVPPFHPDYQQADDYTSPETSDDDYGSDAGEYAEGRLGGMVRRGSEGYEVRQVDREEILRRYVESRGEEAGRYRRYVPDPPSEPDSEPSEGDEVPLVHRVNRWREGESIA